MTVFQIREPSSYNGTTQQLTFNTTAAVSSAAFGSETQQIRITANGPCSYLIYSSTDTATNAGSSSPFMPAQWVEYVTVRPGQRVSVLGDTASGGSLSTANGNFWVTELT